MECDPAACADIPVAESQAAKLPNEPQKKINNKHNCIVVYYMLFVFSKLWANGWLYSFNVSMYRCIYSYTTRHHIVFYCFVLSGIIFYCLFLSCLVKYCCTPTLQCCKHCGPLRQVLLRELPARKLGELSRFFLCGQLVTLPGSGDLFYVSVQERQSWAISSHARVASSTTTFVGTKAALVL